jgi:hypothetical protein
MGLRPRIPPGWITVYEVARANGLRPYYRLAWRLCRLAPRLTVRRFGGVRCLRLVDLAEFGRRLDAWRSDRPWTRFAPARPRRRRKKHG